ncbi:MAG: hypothetical protein WC292_06705, partial [Clostridia bacterium]
IAMSFWDKYPITEFMTGREIDYLSATIKDNASISVAIVGFGELNREIFLTSVANNQLLAKEGDAFAEKPINYWLYAYKEAKGELDDSYGRYSNAILDASEYLPLPPKPANETFLMLDIGSTSFYQSLMENLTRGKVYNYIIINFGTDEENANLANILATKLQEWDVDKHTKVFVRILGERQALAKGIIAFGSDNESQTAGDRIAAMALDRHLSYSLSGSIDDEQNKREMALKKWAEQDVVQQESNLYACLGIRLKLHLLGFDYRPKYDLSRNAEEEFAAAYEKGDKIIVSAISSDGRKTIQYTTNYVKGSVRQALAIQEHQRWNAYMINCGFIPSSIAQIAANDSKNMREKRHGNITTFQGLVEFSKIMAKINHKSPEDTDVIKYDYQVMDDVVWLLSRIGYKIIKR